MKFNVDIKFQSIVDRTDRVMDVAESFGVGLSDKMFVIFDNLEIEVNKGDVVYITGQSGSGKSLLLRDLSKKLAKNGFNVASVDEVELEEKPIIDQVGKNMTDATALLARVGIGDAQLYIRKPSQLSDGQKYRLRLAKLIESGADVWVADEFGAVLDRTTAKVVAYNMQRAARQYGVTLIVATTHTDLEDEIGPNVKVVKRFREIVKVEYDEAKHMAVKPCVK